MIKSIFENTATAFALKSDSELRRAYFLFKMIAHEPLVKIGAALARFALKTRLPIDGIVRVTVFDQFCGGVTEADCLSVINSMYTKNIHSILDYSVEGKEEDAQFDLATEKILKTIDFMKEKEAIAFAVFKPSGFGKLGLFEKIGLGVPLDEKEIEAWYRIENRYDQVCKKAFNLDALVLIDAEESWMQKAADMLAERMMKKYNKKKALIFNTLQMYRWDRMDYLRELHEKSISQKFKIGIKVVRGAYLEKENERAEEMGYASPICASKKATDDNFDACIAYALEHLDRISVFSGTHNESSSYRLMDVMHQKGIARNDSRIWFGQLYGMSDHISFNLAAEGYNVGKYLPFGPVRDVLPYLIRRAEENTSVSGQTSRELDLLSRERRRRKEQANSF